MGDGGSGGDPDNYGQRRDTLLGKMLRIDTGQDGNSWIAAGSTNLSPSDGFNTTIWSYGLRNPWRFSFDDMTGDMFIADVGQNAKEEVNFQSVNSLGGENYGWRECEGLSVYNGYTTDCGAGSTVVGDFDDYSAPVSN